FFSSRRRHTRFSRDWSSDVCSSDLVCCICYHQRFSVQHLPSAEQFGVFDHICQSLFYRFFININLSCQYSQSSLSSLNVLFLIRSEERRVGKDCRCWWRACHCRRKL